MARYKTDTARKSESEPDALNHDRRTWLFGMAAILVMTFLAYLPALRGEFVFDDQTLLQNPYVTSAGEFWKIWLEPRQNPLEPHYWPVTYTVLSLEYRAWGAWPPGYHAVNLLLHIATVFLFWKVSREIGVPGAGWAAAIFALHPMHVESVAWIVELKDMLSGFFYGLAFISFLWFVNRRSWPAYAISIVAFAGAILSKSVVVTLPAGLAVALTFNDATKRKSDIAPARVPLQNALLALVPLLIIGLALAFFDVRVAGEREAIEAEIKNQPWLDRFAIAGRALWFYGSKLIWPSDLCSIYPRWKVGESFLISILLPVIWIPAVFSMRKSFGSWLAGPILCLGYFVATLSPSLGLFPFGWQRFAFVADRFSYLASAGLIILFVSTVLKLADRSSSPARMTKLTMIPVILALGFATAGKSATYRTGEAFWKETIRSNPAASIGYHNLGITFEQMNRLDEAIPLLQKAIELAPQAKYVGDLAEALEKHGDKEAAILKYRESIQMNPRWPESYFNLAMLLDDMDRLGEAMPLYSDAARLAPDWPVARNGYGTALARKGRTKEAVAEFRAALELQKNFPEAEENLRDALAELSRQNAGKIPK